MSIYLRCNNSYASKNLNLNLVGLACAFCGLPLKYVRIFLKSHTKFFDPNENISPETHPSIYYVLTQSPAHLGIVERRARNKKRRANRGRKKSSLPNQNRKKRALSKEKKGGQKEGVSKKSSLKTRF